MKAKPILAGCVLFLAATVFGVPALADPPGRVGRLSYLSGPVSLAPASLYDEWSLAVVNRPVTTGDRIWADEAALAEIRVGSSAIRVGSRTDVDVLTLDDRVTQLRVAQGTLCLRVRNLNDRHIEIDTPAAAVVVRSAGAYRIDVDPSGREANVGIVQGEAGITGPNFNILLREGEEATAYGDSPDYDLNRLPVPDEFDRFCQDRDRHDDQVRSTRYVSYDMTGYEDLDNYGNWTTVADYGNVWFPSRVATDWVPYRDGRWLWVEPWGWTWVDNAPWGFAPFHYGRWAYVGGRWGWCPGEAHFRPVYAPALVAFVGGAGASVSVTAGSPVVGWFPLGYREPYIPWYTVSRAYVREVNVAHVTNVTNITNITTVTNVTNVNYVNRNVTSAITAVPANVFTQARVVAPAALKTPAVRELARAPVVAGGAPVAPGAQSLIVQPARARPPEAVVNRPVVAVNQPAARPAPFTERQQEIARQPDRPFQVKPLQVVPSAPEAAVPGARPPSGAGRLQPPVQVIHPAQPPQPAAQPPRGRESRSPAARPPEVTPPASAGGGRAGPPSATAQQPSPSAPAPAVTQRPGGPIEGAPLRQDNRVRQPSGNAPPPRLPEEHVAPQAPQPPRLQEPSPPRQAEDRGRPAAQGQAIPARPIETPKPQAPQPAALPRPREETRPAPLPPGPTAPERRGPPPEERRPGPPPEERRPGPPPTAPAQQGRPMQPPPQPQAAAPHPQGGPQAGGTPHPGGPGQEGQRPGEKGRQNEKSKDDKAEAGKQ
jgi:hypothetical protein